MGSSVKSREIDVYLDGTSVVLSLCDTRGYQKAVLTRSGTSWSTSAWTHHDSWGFLGTGFVLGGACQRCCANLGHVTNDDSRLDYMRFQFWEPLTERFLSETPSLCGSDRNDYASECQDVFVGGDDHPYPATALTLSLSTLGDPLVGRMPWGRFPEQNRCRATTMKNVKASASKRGAP
jgi:hypothetical protein